MLRRARQGSNNASEEAGGRPRLALASGLRPRPGRAARDSTSRSPNLTRDRLWCSPASQPRSMIMLIANSPGPVEVLVRDKYFGRRSRPLEHSREERSRDPSNSFRQALAITEVLLPRECLVNLSHYPNRISRAITKKRSLRSRHPREALPRLPVGTELDCEETRARFQRLVGE
jgi:hypothetical protein